jgi:hypothetical protein
LESVQQNACMRLGLLECHAIWRCEMWARAECIGTISTNATEGVNPVHVIFVGIQNAGASVAALEEGAHAHQTYHSKWLGV